MKKICVLFLFVLYSFSFTVVDAQALQHIPTKQQGQSHKQQQRQKRIIQELEKQEKRWEQRRQKDYLKKQQEKRREYLRQKKLHAL